MTRRRTVFNLGGFVCGGGFFESVKIADKFLLFIDIHSDQPFSLSRSPTHANYAALVWAQGWFYIAKVGYGVIKAVAVYVYDLIFWPVAPVVQPHEIMHTNETPKFFKSDYVATAIIAHTSSRAPRKACIKRRRGSARFSLSPCQNTSFGIIVEKLANYFRGQFGHIENLIFRVTKAVGAPALTAPLYKLTGE